MSLIYKPLETQKFYYNGKDVQTDPKSMPRSRRRHHSRSRSRSRSHSYDRDRDAKRRKIDAYDSPHKSSVSSEPDVHTVDDVNTHLAPAVKSNTEQLPNTTQVAVNEESNSKEETVGTISDSLLDENTAEHLQNKSPCIKDKDHSKNESLSAVTSPEKDSEINVCKTDQRTIDLDQPQGENIPDIQPTIFEKADSVEEEENDMSMDIANETDKSDLGSATDLVASDSDDSKSDHAAKDSRNSTSKNLTPKQVQKRKEIELKRLEKVKEREKREKIKLEERERLKQEKLKQKQEREERKTKEKQEKLEQKQRELEQKQKEKEFKEEQRKKEREEKELKRKEKEEKEEQKRKEKEQERLKKQQEIEEKSREKQRAEEQKQKTAAAFVNFFVPKKPNNESKEKRVEENQNSLFKNFEVKSDMRLPPERRKPLTTEEKNTLANCVENPNDLCSYLKDLKSNKTRGKCGKTWPYEDPLDEVMIIEDETDLGETVCEEKDKVSKLRAKFLKFHENRRPAYFGTWRKKSSSIKPRKPLGQDTNILNYDEDSDDDWEEEEQGESLDESDGEEKDPETVNDDYEVDNDFFVPHGHLSDDEVDDEATAKLSPESLKQKLKLLKEEFDEDMKSKCNRIKPRFIGCIWYDKDGGNVDEPIDRYLKPLSIITNTFIVVKKRSDNTRTSIQIKKGSSKPIELDATLMPDFIRLVHGNINKRTLLATEFSSFIGKSGKEVNVSKANLGRKIKQMADWIKCPDDGPMLNKFCWYVSEDIRKKYNVNIGLPNQWEMSAKD